MELEELKATWGDYHQKLDRSLKFNRRIFREMRLDKTRSRMRRLMILRICEALWFLVIGIALWGFTVTDFSWSGPTLSALVLGIFCTIGLAGSIGQIALIGTVDYADSVTVIQKELAKIRTHGIAVMKLLAFSIPCYLAYVFLAFRLLFNIDLYAQADRNWLTLNIILSLGLIIPTVWLCKELNFKATSPHWMKRLIDEAGGGHITAAVALLDEIEAFKREDDEPQETRRRRVAAAMDE